MLVLSNPYLDFGFDPDTGQWSLFPRKQPAPSLEGVRFGAVYRTRGKAIRWEGAIAGAHASTPTQVDSPHGRLTALTVRTQTPPLSRRSATAGKQGLRWGLEFALPEDSPFLLWRAIARNEGDQPLQLDAIDLLVAGPRYVPGAGNASRFSKLATLLGLDAESPESPTGALRLHPSPGRLAFFSNGYQSWSFAGALQAHMRQPSSLFGPLGDPKHLNLITPSVERRGHFSSDMFGVLGDRDHRAGVVIGFISQREQFGVAEVLLDRFAPSLRLTAQCDGVTLPPGGERATDWAYLQFIALDDFDPLTEYVEAVARENGARVPQHTPVGWCSWYHYFDQVKEQDLIGNLEAIVRERPRLPLDFVQLDDGYQAQVGDWFETNAKFPHGLKWLAERIRAQGHTPGLWLAPFMARSDAKLIREHPDWFLRPASGRPVNAGYNWFKWCYGLDPTHPGVREHTRRLIATAVREWGFPYLKLDFLYAAALPARRYDPALTRAQAMRLALKDIREAAGPDTFLLGCGCPLGSAVGLVDGMRISTDVSPSWKPELFTPMISQLIRHEMDYPCVRSAIRNTVNRAPLHRRWWLNDPDCLLVRDHDTRLSEVEVRSLATVIALSGGMFLVSDDMTRLNPKRYRYMASLMPVLGVSARARNWMETDMPDVLSLPLRGASAPSDWLVAGIFNWQDRPRDRALDLSVLGLDPGQAYFVSDFWEGRHWTLEKGEPLKFAAMPPHGSHLVAIRKAAPGPALVASSFHFSQGSEIRAWQASANTLRLKVDLGRADEGELRLSLPARPDAAQVEGQPLPVRDLGQGVYSLRFAVNSAAEVEICW